MKKWIVLICLIGAFLFLGILDPISVKSDNIKTIIEYLGSRIYRVTDFKNGIVCYVNENGGISCLKYRDDCEELNP